MRTLFILLISCVSCLAQFGVEQPMFAIQSTVPYSVTNDPAIAYYWNYNDLANGTVTSWADRKQGLTWVRYRTSAGPTKSASGVFFDVSSTRDYLLTNTSTFTLETNSCIAFIFKPIDHSSMSIFCGMTNPPAPVSGFGYSSADGAFVWNGSPGTVLAKPWDDNNMKWIFMGWSNNYLRVWTNAPDGLSYAKSYETLGSSGTPAIHQLGSDFALFYVNDYKGYINEFIMWTNTTTAIPALLSNHWNYTTSYYTFP